MKLILFSLLILSLYVSVKGEGSYGTHLRYSGHNGMCFCFNLTETLDPANDEPKLKTLPKYNCAGTFFTNNELESVLTEAVIVPDVVDAAPQYEVKVHYGNLLQPWKPTDLDAQLGNFITTEDTEARPLHVSYPTEADTYYTVTLVDPDAVAGIHNHWLVVNVKGCQILDGKFLAGYRGPNPSEGTGDHRYVFLIFKQPGEITIENEDAFPGEGDSETTRERRKSFSLANFIEEHALTVHAGNYFISRHSNNK